MYPHQAERLTDALVRARVDALVATSPENVAYLTGFTSLASAVHDARQFGVFTSHGTALVVPAIDVAAVVEDVADVDHVVCYGEFSAAFADASNAETRRIRQILTGATPSPVEALATALAVIGVRHGSVGLDESGLEHAAWQELVERLADLEIRTAAGHLADARRVKGPYEIDCLGHALRIAEEALDALIQALDRGMTEHEAAKLYAGEVLMRGASPSRALVAMGERTWIPAPRPSDRALRPGDLVRFDVGAIYKGYCGSVARAAVFGEPAPHVETAYVAVQAGLEKAIAQTSPGTPAGAVAEATVAATRAAGLSAYACPLVGHGIGLAPAERPMLATGSTAAIEAGEVLCVEVPYYEIGSKGLAVRDTLLITSGGSRVMNRSRHDLIVLD